MRFVVLVLCLNKGHSPRLEGRKEEEEEVVLELLINLLDYLVIEGTRKNSVIKSKSNTPPQALKVEVDHGGRGM